MLLSNLRKITLTLFFYSALVVTLAISSEAHIHQRDHASLKRLVKKRSPFPQEPSRTVGPVAGAGAAVPTFPPTSSGSASNSVPTSSVSQSSASEPASISQSSSSAVRIT